MKEFEKEIKIHQNNIKMYIEQQKNEKDIKNIDALNEKIINESYFIKALINI